MGELAGSQSASSLPPISQSASSIGQALKEVHSGRSGRKSGGKLKKSPSAPIFEDDRDPDDPAQWGLPPHPVPNPCVGMTLKQWGKEELNTLNGFAKWCPRRV